MMATLIEITQTPAASAILGAIVGAVIAGVFAYLLSRREKRLRDDERKRLSVRIDNGIPTPIFVVGPNIYHLININVANKFYLNDAAIFPFRVVNSGNAPIERLKIRFFCDLRENNRKDAILLCQYYATPQLEDAVKISKTDTNRLEIEIAFLNEDAELYFEIFIDKGFRGKIGAVPASIGVLEDVRSQASVALSRPPTLKPKAFILRDGQDILTA